MGKVEKKKLDNALTKDNIANEDNINSFSKFVASEDENVESVSKLSEPEDENIVLKAKNISIGYKRGNKVIKRVHNDLSFSLNCGELICLLGPNGAGKSTLLKTIGTFIPTIEGDINLYNKNISEYSEKELSKLISVVLTDKTSAGGLRVKELVALGRQPHTGFFGRLNKNDLQIVDKALYSTGIIDKKHCFVAELSDGERQKVMIAKSLAQEAPIIILDEPTSFLDILSRIEIINLLQNLAHNHKKVILLSTHDLEQALLFSDQLLLLSKEKGLIQGTPEDLIFSNALNDLFYHKDISFDRKNGSFQLEPEYDINICIKANEELSFWTRNIVKRYGFNPLSYDATDKQFEIEIELFSPNKIAWRENNDKEYIVNSFYELSKLLNKKRESLNIKQHL
ncbi:MAG: ABC transporter ATP-binding protein [Bacteroidales bacterium]|nr:ABC transporter ATP-binding protein [Bacteroidales bacterium]